MSQMTLTRQETKRLRSPPRSRETRSGLQTSAPPRPSQANRLSRPWGPQARRQGQTRKPPGPTGGAGLRGGEPSPAPRSPTIPKGPWPPPPSFPGTKMTMCDTNRGGERGPLPLLCHTSPAPSPSHPRWPRRPQGPCQGAWASREGTPVQRPQGQAGCTLCWEPTCVSVAPRDPRVKAPRSLVLSSPNTH